MTRPATTPAFDRTANSAPPQGYPGRSSGERGGIWLVRRMRGLAAAVLCALASATCRDLTAPRTSSAPQSIRVAPHADSLNAIGASNQLVANARLASGALVDLPNAAWRSLAPDVATVDARGVVVAHSVGSAPIIVTSAAWADTANVVVRQIPRVVHVLLGHDSVSSGDTLVVDVDARDSAGTPIPSAAMTWHTADSAVIRFATSDHRAIAGQRGTTYIGASDWGVRDSARIVVKPGQPARGHVTPGDLSVTVNEVIGYSFGAYDSYGNAVDLPSLNTMQWQSSAPTVASVSSAGLVHALAVGDATISAVFGSLSAARHVSVQAAPPVPVGAATVSGKAVLPAATDRATIYVKTGLSGASPLTAGDMFSAVVSSRSPTGISLAGRDWMGLRANIPGSVAPLSSGATDPAGEIDSLSTAAALVYASPVFSSAPAALSAQLLDLIRQTPAVQQFAGVVSRYVQANGGFSSPGQDFVDAYRNAIAGAQATVTAAAGVSSAATLPSVRAPAALESMGNLTKYTLSGMIFDIASGPTTGGLSGSQVTLHGTNAWPRRVDTYLVELDANGNPVVDQATVAPSDRFAYTFRASTLIPTSLTGWLGVLFDPSSYTPAASHDIQLQFTPGHSRQAVYAYGAGLNDFPTVMTQLQGNERERYRQAVRDDLFENWLLPSLQFLLGNGADAIEIVRDADRAQLDQVELEALDDQTMATFETCLGANPTEDQYKGCIGTSVAARVGADTQLLTDIVNGIQAARGLAANVVLDHLAPWQVELVLKGLSGATAWGAYHTLVTARPREVFLYSYNGLLGAEQIAVASGDRQSGVAPGTLVPSPLKVLVRNASGTPVAHAWVRWETANGGAIGDQSVAAGGSSVAYSESDGNGVALVYWRIGQSSSDQSLVASLDGTLTAVTFSVHPGQPQPVTLADLTPQDVGVSPSLVTVGGGVTVTYAVLNLGGTVAPLSHTKVQLKSAGGALLVEQTFATSSIPAGGSATESRTLTVPLGTTPGSFSAFVLVDNNIEVGQSSTANDASSGVSFLVQAAPALATGTVSSTLRNNDGTVAATAGVRQLLYTNPIRTMTTNPATFSAVPVGSDLIEGYHTGTFFGEEFWASQTAAVVAGATTNVALTRAYPYAAAVVIKNDATGAVLAAGQTVPTGTTLRAEVTVRNDVPGLNLSTKVRFIFDRDQSASYDSDQSASPQTVGGGGSTKTFTFAYSPSAAGPYFYALEVTATLDNGNTVRTDSWTWSPAATVAAAPSVTLADLTPQGGSATPNPVAVGGTLVMAYSIANIGGTPAPGSHTKVQLKTAAGALLLEQVFATGVIPANGSVSEARSLVIPAGTATGSCNAFVIVDNNNEVTQSGTGNDVSGAIPFVVQPAPVTTGTVTTTLRNIDGTLAPSAGVRQLLYTSPIRTVAGVNPATFTAVPGDSEMVEGYYTGTFFGEEFWTSQTVLVAAGATTNVALVRTYPYAAGVVIKNNATGAVLAAGQSVPAGTTLRAEVTVRNDVPGLNLSSTVRFLFDRDQSPSYDSDQSASPQIVSGSGSTKVFTFTYTPAVTGPFSYALEVITTLDNGNTVRTDSWSWTQAVTMAPGGDYSVTVNPTSRTVTQGGTATYGVTVQSLNAFSGTVSLSAVNLPGNQTLAGTGFAPQNVIVAANGMATSTLTIVTNTATPSGTANITVQGQSGSISHSAPISLTVNQAATTGTVISTLRNIDGALAPSAGVRQLLYTSPIRTISGSNPATFTAVPAGSDMVEGYFTGTFFGEEFWTSQTVAVTAATTTNAVLTRTYPYAAAVAIKNNATGAVLAAGQTVSAGTTLRAEVTVRNDVPGLSLNSKVRFLFDRDQSGSYDSDQTAATQTVNGSGSTRTFTFTYTPSVTGQFYYALEVTTTLANGNTVRTDSWNWSQTVKR